MTPAFVQHKLVQKPSKQHRFDCLVKIAQFQSGTPKLACYLQCCYHTTMLYHTYCCIIPRNGTDSLRICVLG